MNERIRKLAEQAGFDYDEQVYHIHYLTELIVRECSQALFNESERLFGLYSEETDWQQAERYELCSEQCTDNIALIEKHFGVEE